MNKNDFERLTRHFAEWVEFFKNSAQTTTAIMKSLEIKDNDSNLIGYLVPMAECHKRNPTLISKLTMWRNEHQYAYPSNFEATDESTSKWFENGVLRNTQRLLFWVADLNLDFIGHLGIVINSETNEFEIDNVLRGSGETPGIMNCAMRRLEFEIEKEFSVEEISLRVLLSNERAVAFYKNLEYVEIKREALVWASVENEKRLVRGEPADDFFVTMSKSLLVTGSSSKTILTAGPSISVRESAYVFDATTNGWNSKHSDYISAFEREFAEFVGVKHAMATSSCSGALHLALLSLGIGVGDEVIVPEVTWVATASAVRYVGAVPVFADIDPTDWTMSLESLNAVLTPKTKAIIPVHLYGYGAPLPEIINFARENDLKIVEDAAPAIGTIIGDKMAGTFGDLGCYSFQGAKLLVTGEGGMLVTNDSELYSKAKKIQDHGRKPGTFWIEELGYKYKMNNITAALGLAQIQRSANQIIRKRRINSWYKENLAGVNGISFQEERPGTQSICWMTSILLDPSLPIDRNLVMSKLSEKGIDSRPAFPAISQYTFWPTRQEAKPVGALVGERAMNLPSGVMLTMGDIDRVSSELKKILGEL